MLAKSAREHCAAATSESAAAGWQGSRASAQGPLAGPPPGAGVALGSRAATRRCSAALLSFPDDVIEALNGWPSQSLTRQSLTSTVERWKCRLGASVRATGARCVQACAAFGGGLGACQDGLRPADPWEHGGLSSPWSSPHCCVAPGPAPATSQENPLKATVGIWGVFMVATISKLARKGMRPSLVVRKASSLVGLWRPLRFAALVRTVPHPLRLFVASGVAPSLPPASNPCAPFPLTLLV